MELMEAMDLIESEFEKNGLFEFGWTYGFDTKFNDRFLGMCCYEEHTIYIAAKHIRDNRKVDVLDTIRHEIAHALTPFEEEDDHHGPLWRSLAAKLGATPSRSCPVEKEQKVIYLPYVP